MVAHTVEVVDVDLAVVGNGVACERAVGRAGAAKVVADRVQVVDIDPPIVRGVAVRLVCEISCGIIRSRSIDRHCMSP